jgi:uncharacterized protein YdaU (DUF1376 family)
MAEKGSRHRPWFPFFAGDFINATRRWSCEEIGAYILLLGEQWINEDVPTDVDELARIHPDIAKHWHSKLQRKFPGGRNPRMEELREEMLERSNKNRDAAMRRWGRDQTSEESDVIDASADAYADAIAGANAHAIGYANDYAKGHAKSMRKGMLSTPTSTSISKPISKTKNKRSTVSDDMWKKFGELYPKRHGPDPSDAARKRAEVLLKNGVQWNDIMEGVRRYSIYCKRTAIAGTQFVKQKQFFLSADKALWTETYEEPQQDVGGRGAGDPDAELRSMATILGMSQGESESMPDYLKRLRDANDRRIAGLQR